MQTTIDAPRKTWYKFYKDRVNNTDYENTYRKNYLYHIRDILDTKTTWSKHKFKQEGCGIATFRKLIREESPAFANIEFTDINHQMLQFARVNNYIASHNTPLCWQEDILQDPKKPYHPNQVVITVGVLEHFSDKQILQIFNKYKRHKVKSCHYVPLGGVGGYSTPSFGDERLLDSEYWLKLLKPEYYTIKGRPFSNGGLGLDLFMWFNYAGTDPEGRPIKIEADNLPF
jgi:hypothetical protein